MLVLLRIAIGWHFLYQGLGKLGNPEFTSAGFLKQAKGPLAGYYHDLIPDLDGRQRLAGDGKAIIDRLNQANARAVAKYRLDRDQQAALDKLLAHRQQQVRDFLAAKKGEITDYFHELDRWQRKQDPRIAEVGFQQKRLWDQQQQLRAKAGPWLTWIDDQETKFAADVDLLLTPQQRSLGSLNEPPTKLDWADQAVTWTNLAIGGCLILGLFTRVAAAGGAIFLLSIILAQPPWPTIYPPDPPSAGHSLLVNKEVVEMMALAALAALPVGRWGGLDFFLSRFAARRQRDSRPAARGSR